MQLTSDSFYEQGQIPASRSPQLGWIEVPGGTESLVLLCMDADAPADFFLWCVADIPPSLPSIAAGEAAHLRQGLNDYGGLGYHGPLLPPNETHQYVFRIYALDVARLELPKRFTGGDVLNAIYGHIIDEAQLIGAYTQT
ncbi:YbhB/YbcL family Raf kinase inhibitor-like protein [Duganella sp. FT135W]|uniref:YbhB/YbcL family Raf kinase inhibitor-like protein n=1 Tax=Duganella flavida TaxID=2692175 RepID=A0A6L8K6S7_9BURK|nr:YbhB/YbcL family Raf kinase inhibitor-like protein [Duganella flavida]MYM21584.1 YbhB/YbcL family Raf kinase inhibitor-like protein [Duganella flavida]